LGGTGIKKSGWCHQTVIIGQDSRNSSDMLANAITAGLTWAGIEVWQLGLCPTPCVAYLTRESEAMGGIMISASHNPPEDNGIKFFDSSGLKLSGSLAAQIEAGLRGNLELADKPVNWGKATFCPELIQKYYQAVIASVGTDINLSGLKIVLDLAWGAAVNLAPLVFQTLGRKLSAYTIEPMAIALTLIVVLPI